MQSDLVCKNANTVAKIYINSCRKVLEISYKICKKGTDYLIIKLK